MQLTRECYANNFRAEIENKQSAISETLLIYCAEQEGHAMKFITSEWFLSTVYDLFLKNNSFIGRSSHFRRDRTKNVCRGWRASIPAMSDDVLKTNFLSMTWVRRMEQFLNNPKWRRKGEKSVNWIDENSEHVESSQ